MSLALLAPLGLAALIALALPLLIHLVRRLELRTTEFAAMRWISERIRPRRRLRFERPWLLLLRLALLALLALLLARPVVNESSITAPARVVIAPGSDVADAREVVTIAGADWRWLAPGFPAIETAPPSTQLPLASLLREADAELPRDAKLAVVVPQELAGLDGERPVLSRAVEWHVVPGRAPAAAPNRSRDPFVLAVRFTPAAEPNVKYLRAAVAAWNAHDSARVTLDAQPQDVPLSQSTHDLVWLGADTPPAITQWIEAGGTSLVDHQPRAAGAPIWRDTNERIIARVEPFGRGRLVTLAAAFSPQTMPDVLDAGFPDRLFSLFESSAAPTRARADAMRPVQAVASDAKTSTPASTKPLDPWLILLIALLVLTERYFALRPRASR